MARRFETAVVVGASSGIGEALARRLASEGCRVALVARREDRLTAITGEINAAAGEERSKAWTHDVRRWEQVPELFEAICRWLGGLDLIVYASGMAYPVRFREFDTAKDLEVYEVNFLGAVAWLNPAAARFGRLGRGTIVGIGSVAGDRGRSNNPAYNTSKAALHTYLEALRNRIARTGARVVTIKPGFVDTEMVAEMKNLLWLIPPQRAAEIILKKARRGVVTAYVPARWRLVSWVVRSIPSRLFRYLKV